MTRDLPRQMISFKPMAADQNQPMQWTTVKVAHRPKAKSTAVLKGSYSTPLEPETVLRRAPHEGERRNVRNYRSVEALHEANAPQGHWTDRSQHLRRIDENEIGALRTVTRAFALRLQQYRQRHHYSQEQLAQKMSLPVMTVRAYEKVGTVTDGETLQLFHRLPGW